MKVSIIIGICMLLLTVGCKNLSKYDYACQECGYGNVTDYKEEKIIMDRVKIECDGSNYIEIDKSKRPIHNKWGDIIRYENRDYVKCKIWGW